MKFVTPEISWHNRDPIYSVDIQQSKDGICRLASCGTDKDIRIWSISKNSSKAPQIDFLSTLSRHQKTVNVVRFSPDGQVLASGGDDSFVILWKPSDSSSVVPAFDEEDDSKERWNVFKVLRSHLEDVLDLSWSSDGLRLVSGSVDNTAILWDAQKGCKLWMFSEHKSFVQGVTFDPKFKFIATMSCDRSLRVYQLSNNSLVHDIRKLPLASKPSRMFHDDTMKSFFRRLSFSPDGRLLVVPSGCLELESNQELLSTTFLFSRENLSKPIAHLPLPSSCKTSLAVRFCPKLFKLWDVSRDGGVDMLPGGVEIMLKLPYRMVFAIITDNSVVIHDTQFTSPIAYISNVHYHTLSDISWSRDGLLLVVSSTDGYCTVISFERGELGEPYESQEPMIVEPFERIEDAEIRDDLIMVEATASDQVLKVQPPLTTPNEDKAPLKPTPSQTQAKKPRRVAFTTLCAN